MCITKAIDTILSCYKEYNAVGYTISGPIRYKDAVLTAFDENSYTGKTLKRPVLPW